MMLGEASKSFYRDTRLLEKESTKSWSTFVTSVLFLSMILELVIVSTDLMRI